MDIHDGFYMVKFDTLEDRNKVIESGCWIIFDNYLVVRNWTPDFVSLEAKISRTLVSVQFLGLRMVYYDESVLLTLPEAIGVLIKVDLNTLNFARGKFARVCIEIDLTRPIIGKVWLDGHWYKVQYEGLHVICTSCGYYGHERRECNGMKQTSFVSEGDSLNTQNTNNLKELQLRLLKILGRMLMEAQIKSQRITPRRRKIRFMEDG